jgi:hypothetical protein
LGGQQETDISNTNTITTRADPAAVVATGIPPPQQQQQRLEDNEQPENQE